MSFDDADLDALLRADATEGPADAGFTERLMGRLPARRRVVAAASDPLPVRLAQWVAVGAMVFALGWIWPEVAGVWPQHGQLGESLITVAVLLGLVTWWSLPQSRGSLLH